MSQGILSTIVDAETIHAAFHIPVNQEQAPDINFALSKYDMVVIDKASLVSPQTSIIASTLNVLTSCPLVIRAGDKCQQQVLQTVQGRIANCISIPNDDTFQQSNSVKHSLYQQFRIVDPHYAHFIDVLRYHQPTQLQDEQIFSAFLLNTETSIMTVSRAAAQRVNEIVENKLFRSQAPQHHTLCHRD